MKNKLQTGDRVEILPIPELSTVLQNRRFCSDDETRQRVADKIGDTKGIVYSIEEKYAFDHFYYQPDGSEERFSIPYQSVVTIPWTIEKGVDPLGAISKQKTAMQVLIDFMENQIARFEALDENGNNKAIVGVLKVNTDKAVQIRDTVEKEQLIKAMENGFYNTAIDNSRNLPYLVMKKQPEVLFDEKYEKID